MVLTPEEARRFYDRFGKKQDAQGFYEDPALDDLVRHASLAEAQAVFEFGCGSGRFAARLLAGHLPHSATYLGCDVSSTMVALATERLAPFADRARATLSDGTMHFPLAADSVDRVLCTYVLDLLSETQIAKFLQEAARVLTPGGKLCLVSLTHGTTFPSRVVSTLWGLLYRLRPTIVGGCRPLRLDQFLSPDCWETEYRNVVTPFAVPSEIHIDSPIHQSPAHPRHPAEATCLQQLQATGSPLIPFLRTGESPRHRICRNLNPAIVRLHPALLVTRSSR